MPHIEMRHVDLYKVMQSANLIFSFVLTEGAQ